MSESDAPFSQFKDIVQSEEELRGLIGPTFPPAAQKVIHHIDEIAAAYIANATFIVVATSDGDGQVEISPKGDPAGFVKVLDDTHIAIPDRPGNRRLDTFHNLFQNPHLAVIFLVPGTGETLRVYGEARLVRDPDLLEQMAVQGRAPLVATVLHVERVMIHCPKCIARANLWGTPADTAADLPHIGQVMAVHAKLTGTPEEQFKTAEDAGMPVMY
ncbi:MAG: MSMEG_1061 family FMN-dependent PPOX-type flavoprotein [Pseudomonadota bacterium]